MDLFCLFGVSNWRVKRKHFHEFMLWLHQTLQQLSGDPSHAPSRKHVLACLADEAAKGADVLCLDELAITNVADAAIVAELFRLLAERQVVVVCTTNRPPEDLYKDGLHRERYIPQLVQQLHESFLVVAVDGPDYREALLRSEGLSSAEGEAGDSAQALTDRVFFEGGCAEEALRRALAAEELPRLDPLALKVSWGRFLQVPGAGAGVARFHFDDLCRRPLAAEDFLHVASNFHTVFVHDVPRLALEEHNEARRFTNLIDALYEHSVRLVCHSTGPLSEVLSSVEVLQEANEAGNHDADKLGVFETMYDDSPNFQIQIKELGSREKWQEVQAQKREEEERHRMGLQRAEAKRLGRMAAPEAAQGDTGSGWSAAPANADLSAPDQGVAGVMVAAVGSLQESGFAARRAASRLKEMQTSPYLEAARQRRGGMRAFS